MQHTSKNRKHFVRFELVWLLAGRQRLCAALENPATILGFRPDRRKLIKHSAERNSSQTYFVPNNEAGSRDEKQGKKIPMAMWRRYHFYSLFSGSRFLGKLILVSGWLRGILNRKIVCRVNVLPVVVAGLCARSLAAGMWGAFACFKNQTLGKQSGSTTEKTRARWQ